MPAAFGAPCDETIIRLGADTAACSKSRGRWVLAATILASSMAFIDGTVVNVALPALQRTLNATAVDVQWVVEAYALLLSAFLLTGGSLGDHYGRRRIFLIGVALFAVASAGCGFAATIHQLIIARAFQGLGAAFLVPGSLAIISSTFPEQSRGSAIGIWSAFSAITAAIGPLIGGWLIENVSWRAVFFINLPLAFLVILISLRHVAESSDQSRTPVDWLGAMLAAAGLGALVFALLESSRLGLGHPSVGVAFALAGLLLIIFLVVEARLSHPMLPLTLFRSRTFTGANLLTLFLYAALSGTLFFLPLNLIQVQGYSATAAGASLLPFIIIMSFLSPWAGGLVTKYGARVPLVIGPLIAALGFALFVLPGIGGSYWTNFFPPMVALGLGMAISVAPLTTTVMNSVPSNRVGLASGVNNAVARSAGLLAIAVLGLIMLRVFGHALDARSIALGLPPSVSEALQTQRTRLGAIEIPRELSPASSEAVHRAVGQAFVSGFRVVTTVGALLAIASSLTALTLIQKSATTASKRPN